VSRLWSLIHIAALISLASVSWLSCSEDKKSVDPNNRPPVIQSITADPDTFYAGQHTTVTVVANDPDGDILQYFWEARKLDRIGGQGNTVMLEACDCEIRVPTDDIVIATVRDGRGGEALDSVSVHILPLGE
jgi:hypothetical protein